MNTQQSPQLDTTPKMLSAGASITSAVVLLSALPWLWLSIGHFGGFAWGLFGFELVLILGCCMTILVGLGRVQVDKAFPMAVTCLIGTILVGVVFGLYVDAKAKAGDDPSILPWINRTILLRLGAIVILSLIATLDVFRRDARSWGVVFRSMIFLVPVFAAIAWLKLKGLPAATDAAGEPSPMKIIVILLAGLFIGILFSIGGHLFIRAYEVALPDSEDAIGSEKTAKTSS